MTSEQLDRSHVREWLASGVAPEIIKLNVFSLKEFEPYDRLLYALPNSERRNDGRIRDKWLRRYHHIEGGGWWCSGIDIFTGEDSQWGQFKPNFPYCYQEKPIGFSLSKTKTIKYEPPYNVPTEIFALKVTLSIWQAIARRFDVTLPEKIEIDPEGRAIGFWKWVIANPKIPVIITEGAKKAGVILTAGYVAIALPGIYNGYRQDKDDWGNKIGVPALIPQLKVFAVKNREIIFCFDNDVKPKTVKNVRTAISKTGKLFALLGCRVSVITWNSPEKGVDDLIVTRGQNYFHQLISARLPLFKFNLTSLLSLSKYSPLTINQPYLSDNLVPPEKAQLIGLRSPKGTGKTEWLACLIQKYIRDGKPVLIITHRIQLAKALCARFGIDHIEEIRNSPTQGISGYGLCIDSLHSNSMAHFNPEHWSEAIVILDECEQVIWHLLDSSTCQDNRVAIIENFQRLLRIVISSGGKIYLSDADLSTIAIDYVEKLINLPVQMWVVENVYKSFKERQLYSYSGNDPREIISALINAIERGGKPLINTTGQKAKSKWGSINLESYLQKKFPALNILRIDRDSVSEPSHPAYGCMSDLDAILKNYDIVIASPVLETGISIDIKDHFDSVWCIAQGVQTVDAVCQAIERLREGVPRHIWVKATAKGNRIGNGSTSIKALLRSQHQITKSNIILLQRAGINDFDELEVNFSPESLNAWAVRACVVNAGKNEYRNAITSKLKEEGYQVINVKNSDGNSCKIVNEDLQETRNLNYKIYTNQVPQMDAPTQKELEKLNNKRAKTKEERLTERKGNLIKLYGVEVTPDLVEKDDNGWYPQLQLHYYLTVGNIYLAQRDRRSLSKISEQGKGRAFKPDINKRQILTKIKTLQILKIDQFLNPEKEFTASSLAEWFDLAIQLRHDIKTVLGVSINPEKDSAIAVAQRILKKMGLKLEFKYWRGGRGSKQRVYQGCNLNPDGRSFVFANWIERISVAFS